mgnify:CR=1 FL=1
MAKQSGRHTTAAKADLWLPSWPGSEATVLLAIALLMNVSMRRYAGFSRGCKHGLS